MRRILRRLMSESIMRWPTLREKRGKTCVQLALVLLKDRPVSCNWERRIAETNEEEANLGPREDWHQCQPARSL